MFYLRKDNRELVLELRDSPLSPAKLNYMASADCYATEKLLRSYRPKRK